MRFVRFIVLIVGIIIPTISNAATSVKIIQSSDRLSKITISNNVAVFSGKVTAFSFPLFKNLPASVNTLEFNSHGGFTDDALVIYDLIKDRYITYVAENTQCDSACITLFLAGKSRIVQWNTRMLFHASIDEKTGKLMTNFNFLHGEMLKNRGVDAAFVEHFMNSSVRHEKKLYGDELFAVGIATTVNP